VEILPRHLLPSIRESLTDTPVALIAGARQTGKSTLATGLADEIGARYITMDAAVDRTGAARDPAGFLRRLGTPLAIDEIQRVPELLLEIKVAVDRDRRPGSYLLTGSADVLTLPKVADSLAGRMDVFTLWPLSRGEIARRPEGFLARAFDPSRLPSGPGLSRDQILDLVLAGGYPEALARTSPAGRVRWMRSYMNALLDRDVQELAQIDRLADLPALMAALAHRTGGLLNAADVSRLLGIPTTTLHRYLVLLERMYVIQRIPAWHRNTGRRLAKTPKLLMNDSGLAAVLMGADAARLDADPTLIGRLLETFVGMELLKQIGWAERPPRLLHFRTTKGLEVDFVLEDASGDCVGIEVKLGHTVRADDLRGLETLADTLGERFIQGIVLYGGERTVPLGERLVACPLAALWEP